MRIFYMILCCLPFFLSAQENPLALRIDEITAKDTLTGERQFRIKYSLENLTDKKLSFFLDPKTISSSRYGSMIPMPYYKIYQDGEFLEVTLTDSIAQRRFMALIASGSILQADSISGEAGKSDAQTRKHFWQMKNESLKKAVFTMEPHQMASFTVAVLWDKQRYQKYDDNEYYIDEKAKHCIEITINLMTTQFRDDLTPQEYEAVAQNPNFIKGVFVSDKAAINLN